MQNNFFLKFFIRKIKDWVQHVIKSRFFIFYFDSSLSVINEPLPDVIMKFENFYAQRFGGRVEHG